MPARMLLGYLDKHAERLSAEQVQGARERIVAALKD
jgi:hypothetical protein